jgi:hypothetical protein
MDDREMSPSNCNDEKIPKEGKSDDQAPGKVGDANEQVDKKEDDHKFSSKKPTGRGGGMRHDSYGRGGMV